MINLISVKKIKCRFCNSFAKDFPFEEAFEIYSDGCSICKGSFQIYAEKNNLTKFNRNEKNKVQDLPNEKNS